MRGEPSKARRHSWIYMETESGQHQRRTRGIGAGGQIDIYLNVKQMQQFPGLLVKFIVGWIYCFCARLECTDRKPLVKQFIEEACVQMWPMKYIKTMTTMKYSKMMTTMKYIKMMTTMKYIKMMTTMKYNKTMTTTKYTYQDDDIDEI